MTLTAKLEESENRQYKYSTGLKLSFKTQDGKLYHTVIFENGHFYDFMRSLDIGSYYRLKAEVKQNNDEHSLIHVFSIENFEI